MPDEIQGKQILTGTPFGALKFATLGKLFGSQRAALVTILEAIHEIATVSYRSRRGRASGTPNEQDLLSLEQDAYFVRPHHAYVIDGERGSGKTTVLLTLYGYIKAMRLDNVRAPASAGEGDTIRSDLATMHLPAVPGALGDERTALLLPIVFPETMEPHETAMEAVFAHMDQILVRAIKEARIDDPRRRNLDELQAWLRQRIGAAWMYSRKIGEQALANDALTYDEFVLRRAEHNRRSYTRIDTWRYFVDRYLDELGYEVLVLSFDDSDLVPEVADDIMRTIRVYLSHPRIVTLLAIEFRTLQDTLSFFNLSRRSPGLLRHDAGRLHDLMELENSNISAQLDKVLPVGLRHRLETAADQLNNIFEGGFEQFCRTEFQRQATGTEGTKASASWWLLSDRYSGLVSDTVRRIVSIHAGARRPGHDIDDLVLGYSKLSDIASVVHHRLDGVRDAIFSDRIRRTGIVVSQSPTPSTYYETSRRPFSSIEFLLVEFCLDRALLCRSLNTAAVPELGRWLNSGTEDSPAFGAPASGTPFFDPSRTIGVASLFPGLLLPRSCLYLADLSRLDDADRSAPDGNVAWIARLTRLQRVGPDAFRRDIQTASEELASLDEGQALRWLLFQFEELRRGANRFRQGPMLRQILGDAAILPETLFLMLGIVAEGSGRTRQDLVAALQNGAARDRIWDHFERPFFRSLPDFLSAREHLRRSAVQVWINALKVNRRTRTLDGPLYETVLDDGTTLVNGATLLEQTVEALNDLADPRAASLLAWSVEPCLTPVFDMGFSLRSAAPTRQQWDRLAHALRVAADGLGIVGREGRASASRRQELRWRFPDIPGGERKAMADAIEAAAAAIEARLAEGPFAAETIPTRWPTDPIEFSAALLGMTAKALEVPGVLHAG